LHSLFKYKELVFLFSYDININIITIVNWMFLSKYHKCFIPSIIYLTNYLTNISIYVKRNKGDNADLVRRLILRSTKKKTTGRAKIWVCWLAKARPAKAYDPHKKKKKLYTCVYQLLFFWTSVWTFQILVWREKTSIIYFWMF